MPKVINTKSLDISTAKKGQVTIKSPALASALLKDATKMFSDLQPELGNVSLAHAELDDAGRVGHQLGGFDMKKKETRRSAFGMAAIALAGLSLLFASPNVNACSDPWGLKPGNAPRMPFLEQSNGERGQRYQNNLIEGRNNHPIVGLWHVTYTLADGSPFFQSFDEWFSDGLEIESSNVPPDGGNVCVGVWKSIGPRSVRLYHVGWFFNADGSNLLGSFVLNQTNTVALSDTTYQGSFDLKHYDVSGNLLQEHKGTIGAKRITVD